MNLTDEEYHLGSLMFECDDKGKLKPNLNNFAVTIATKFSPITYNNTLYVCDENFLYHENKGDVQSFIQALCEAAGYNQPLESLKRELVGRTRDSNVVQDYPFNKFNGFPANNGVVVFGETIELVPYSADMRFTRRIPVDYNPDADVSLADEILSQWIDMDNKVKVKMFGAEVEVARDKVLLYQIPAQAILQSLPNRDPSKKAYLIMGESNGGKSTYIVLLSKLFNGHKNFSGVSLQTMGGRDAFWKQSLVGKLMNICDDLQAVPLDSTECLKQVTGLREHEVNPKGKDRHMAELTAVHVFTCNRPPEIRGIADTDDAFWGRWEYILFPSVFEKVDGWVEKNLTPELLKGFFLSVCRYAHYMAQNNCLIIRSEGADVKELWRTDSTPLKQFLDENTTPATANDYCYTEDMFNQLEKWKNDDDITESERLHRQKRSPLTITALTQAMLRYGYDTRVVQKAGKRRKAYVGITWMPGAKYSVSESKNSSIFGGKK